MELSQIFYLQNYEADDNSKIGIKHLIYQTPGIEEYANGMILILFYPHVIESNYERSIIESVIVRLSLHFLEL